MDPLTKAHMYGLGIMTGLSLICMAVYYLFLKPKSVRKKTSPQVKRQPTGNQEDTSDSASQSAEWISILEEDPIWYKNLAIRTPAGEILEGWARVSNGDHDYYVSNTELTRVIPEITHWRYINQN